MGEKSIYSVLIPLVATEDGDALLLEVRSKYVSQPGEICFPGGRVEQGETAVEAAVRETCEELGLEAGDIEILSEREPIVMGDERGREVHPIEARLDVKDVQALKVPNAEVAEVFLLPLGWLKQNAPAHYELAESADEDLPDKLLGYLSHYGDYRQRGRTEYLEYKGYGIWGLTARIIKSVREER